MPIIETDDANYVMASLPIRVSNPQSIDNKVLSINNLEDILSYCKSNSNPQSNPQSNLIISIIEKDLGIYAIPILEYLKTATFSSKDLLKQVELSNPSKNKKKHINPLLENNLITYTNPENLNRRNQQYKLTDLGKNLLVLINS